MERPVQNPGLRPEDQVALPRHQKFTRLPHLTLLFLRFSELCSPNSHRMHLSSTLSAVRCAYPLHVLYVRIEATSNLLGRNLDARPAHQAGGTVLYGCGSWPSGVVHIVLRKHRGPIS